MSPKEVLTLIVRGIEIGKYDAVKGIANDCIKQIDAEEKQIEVEERSIRYIRED
jgi:hypothetical protein